jgi:glycosyltransferase involved in cell wall biosynthesis
MVFATRRRDHRSHRFRALWKECVLNAPGRVSREAASIEFEAAAAENPRPGQPLDESPRADAPLSVLLLNSLYTPFVVGGAEVLTEMLANTLAAQGHHVSLVTSCSRDQAFSREQMNGVDVHRFFPKNRWWLYDRFAAGSRKSPIEHIRWRITDAWNRDAGRIFGEILERVRPDIVHTHNIKGFSPVVWHEAKRKRIPVVHTAHSYDVICADGALLDRSRETCIPSSRCMACKVHGAWYRVPAASIDVFCSPSNFLLQAHAEAGFLPKRAALVRNGVAALRSLAIDHQPLAERPIRYLYLGQLSSHKGINTLIEAIRLTRGSPLSIDIAGRGDAEAELLMLAAQDERVRFHGFVEGEEKYRLTASADVLIFPSIWVENAPMSIAEAFRHGLPVIGSDLGAIPEFVEDGRNGLLFEAGNAASLAQRMKQLAERPEDLHRVKQGARRSGASWPTPEAMTSEYVDIYRSLLPLKAASPPEILETQTIMGAER